MNYVERKDITEKDIKDEGTQNAPLVTQITHTSRSVTDGLF